MISEERAKEHEGIVWSIALKHRDQGVDVGDLVSAGWQGMMRADELFDENRGASFATYSYYGVKACVRRRLRSHRRGIPRQGCGLARTGAGHRPGGPRRRPPARR